jgi:hypothetical protein
MVKLLDSDSSIFPDRSGHLLKVRNDRVVAGTKISACQDCCLMDGHGFDNDHGGTADGPFGVVGDMLFAG